LIYDDGKRPDGLTLLPWNSGRSATWDDTVVDTLGNAYPQQSAITGASVAETSAARKTNKHSSLCRAHDFFPVALETLRTISARAQEFAAQIGKRLTEVTTGCVKMQDMKMQDVRMKDQVARQENAGHENEGPSCKP